MKTVKVIWKFKRQYNLRPYTYTIKYGDDLIIAGGSFSFRRTTVV
jgi:hypothetical protein